MNFSRAAISAAFATLVAASCCAAEMREIRLPLGVTPYDFIVYHPEQSFDQRFLNDLSKRGDRYNDHFQVIWDDRRRLMYAFWTQGSWEGAPDIHVCFSKSADKGATWTPPILLAGSETRRNPRPKAYYQQPMLTKSGRLYCLWHEQFVARGYLGSYSDDAGETWSPPQVMGVRRMDQDPTDYRFSANWINWQRPLRIGREGRFFVAASRHGKAPYDAMSGCKVEFWEFLNIDDDPEVSSIRLDYFATNRQALSVDRLAMKDYFRPTGNYASGGREGPAIEEASIVKLPDGRLFALMRSSIGHPVWSQSRDDGRTWSDLKPLRDRDGGTLYLHPRSPCPIYDRHGESAASGEYFSFVHNAFDFTKDTAARQPRRQLYLIAGRFVPDAEQPIAFSTPKLFAPRHYGNAFYTSYTVVDGEGVLWFPDVKYYLLGRKIDDSWWCDCPIPPAPQRKPEPRGCRVAAGGAI